MARHRITGIVDLQLLPPIAPAGPTFVSSSVATFAAADPWVLSKPAGVVNGHLLVLAVTIPAGRFLELPPGWQHVSGSPTAAPAPVPLTGFGDSYMFVAYKVANAEPATYSLNFDVVSAGVGAILVYAGVDSANPIADARGSGFRPTSTPQAPAIDPAVDHCTILALYGCDQPVFGVSWTPPLGYTERIDTQEATVFSSLHVAELRQGYAEKASPTATISLADEGVAFAVALRKA